MADLNQTNSDDQKQLMEAPEAQEVGNRGLSIDELTKRYSCHRKTIYRRMDYLAIESNKPSRKAYLDREQIALMDGLHKYVKKHKVFKGYLELINSKSKEQSNGLSVVKPGNFGSKNSGRNVKTRNFSNAELVDLALEDQSAITIDMIVDAAKRKIIVNRLAEKMVKNPNLIPEEDWEEINAVKQQFEQMLPTPQYTPEQFAEQILISVSGGRWTPNKKGDN